MLIRAVMALSLAVSLSACGETEAENACCAIVPKAKCEAAISGLGVTRTEQDALFGADPACPTTVMSIDRIRALDAQWPQACREAGMSSPLLGLDGMACRSATVAEDPAPPAEAAQ
jgi:hypothetical protein